MLEITAAVYQGLPPERQGQAVIAVPSYGHAGAIELFGSAYHLPRVICTHNNYFLWGMNEPTPQVLIAIGTSRKDLERLYEEVEFATTIPGTYCMSWRRNMRVYIARKPKLELRTVWKDFKNFG
jgi:hypothetical protein